MIYDENIQLKAIKAVLFDMDGVLYVGNTLLPGVEECFDYLKQSQRKLLCLTNFSPYTSAMFVKKLAQMRISIDESQILGSAKATALFLNANYTGLRKVLVVGMEGLKTEISNAGFEVVSTEKDTEIVVAGIDFDLNYQNLAEATLAIRRGVPFVATNNDATYPTERGQTPGAGSIIALLACASGIQPTVVGKPYAAMYELALHELQVAPNEALMVGDRYESDIAGAIKLGLKTAGVLTGVHSREDFEQSPSPPDIICPGLPELIRLFKTADKTFD